MSMDRLRQAIEFTDREDDGWVYWSYQPGHEAAIYDAAKSVLDAPRIWWCEEHRQAAAPSNEYRPRCIWGDLVDNQQPCRMVEASVVVDAPQEGGE